MTKTSEIEQRLEEQRAWTAEVERRAGGFRILSTLPYRKVPFWTRVVDTVSLDHPRLKAASPRLRTWALMGKMLLQANRYQLVLLTGGERSDLVYAAVASLCPWIRTPHVIVDAHWQQARGVGRALQRLLLRMSRRLVAQVQPHSEEEVPLYHTLFGIPLDRLRAIPWSTSLLGFPDKPAPGPDDGEAPYILTGGYSFRDYRVFLAAAAQAGLRVKVGLPKAGMTEEIATLVRGSPHVSLHTDWSNAEYVRQMQRCRVFAMPIEQGLTRSTADQTILNAMHYGKVVVSTDSIGPRIYLCDGENGFLVREPSADAWVAALKKAFGLPPAEYDRVGGNALYDAQVVFNEPLRLARTLDVSMQVLENAPRRR